MLVATVEASFSSLSTFQSGSKTPNLSSWIKSGTSCKDFRVLSELCSIITRSAGAAWTSRQSSSQYSEPLVALQPIVKEGQLVQLF